MSTFAIQAARFLLPGRMVDGGYLVVREGRFAGWTAERPACEVVEEAGATVAPGLVDTHIHGFMDHDVMDGSFAGTDAAGQGLLRHGVTSWLPTTLTASDEQLTAVAADLAAGMGTERGARMQGIHFEGPFFNVAKKGAQNPAYITDPSIEEFDRWQDAAQGHIRKIALAPERDGALEFIAHVVASGCTVALGHTAATYEQALAGVDAGANQFTHTYNAMTPLHHRDPGVVGAAMTTSNTYCELIGDGYHVQPPAMKALVNARGWEHVELITDCLRAGGMPNGDYTVGELPVTVDGTVARLADGTIAGSILTLDKAVRNVVRWGIETEEHALRMATEVPARANGIDDRCGYILPGRDADFVVLDAGLNVQATYLGGEQVFSVE